MTPDEAFLQAILEDPEDAPRLIYADWLEDNGHPERAEFIRTQVERERLAPGDPALARLTARAEQLLCLHWEEWVGPLRDAAGKTWYDVDPVWLHQPYHPDALRRFRRGFVEGLSLNARVFVERAPELFRLAPLRRLRLYQVGEVARELAATPELAGVRVLELCDYWRTPLGAEGAKALASSPHLRRLEALDVYRNNVADAGLQALARAPWLAGLRLLNLRDNEVSAVGVRALADRTHTRLTTLRLGRNPIRDAGASALAGASLLAGLASLDLDDCGLGEAGARALADSPHLRSLITLELDHNFLGAAGAAALAGAPWLGGVRTLSLSSCGLGDAGVEALAGSPRVAGLTSLGLGGNGITERGIALLRASPYLRGLTSLQV
jgi:uncharacterized protein (TIGR02996 family)